MIPCTKPLIRNRSDCALDPTLALGLNSTWSFAQGWRGPGIKSGAKCVNCARVVPQAEDPLFNRRAWRHADQSRPKADQLKCYNCHYYFEINGRERPARLETSRAADSQEFKTKNRSGRTPPPICEHTGCSGPIYRWYPPHSKYYCPLHRDRAIKGTDMDAEPVVRAKKSKRDRDRPDTCEAEDRDETTIKYVGPSKQFYCRAHGHRARAGKSMVLRSAEPDHCEADQCDRTKIKYFTAHAKWYCSAHQGRTTNGQDMDAPIAHRKPRSR
ncbi:hypothetical protein M3J09_001034 [Ascochyta lentis]